MQLIVTFALAALSFTLLWSSVRAAISTRDWMVRGIRTPIVAMCCWWEFATPIFALYHFYLSAHPMIFIPKYHSVSPILVVLRCILAVACGCALWRMSRVAVPLYVARWAWAIVSSALFLLHPVADAPPPSLWMRLSDIFSWVCSLVGSVWFVWWVNEITKPPTESPDMQEGT